MRVPLASSTAEDAELISTLFCDLASMKNRKGNEDQEWQHVLRQDTTTISVVQADGTRYQENSKRVVFLQCLAQP